MNTAHEPKKDIISKINIALGNFFQRTKGVFLALLLIVVVALIAVSVFLLVQNQRTASGIKSS